ncbi:hypothetical protein, partial [Microcoleus sp.]|uniref:hypothetical protein n=1 Tax=Microcoleus sp. TaxID=44472 RepID=UPI0035260FF0
SYTTSLELESKLPDGEALSDLAEGAAYTGVVATYRDEQSGAQKQLTAGEQTTPKQLTHLYASKDSAQRAVDREFKRLQSAASVVEPLQ